MIFAAGFGTRMGSMTKSTPKPMLPLGGRPMIDHALDLAKTAGLETIFANTHYLHEKIEPHLRKAGVTVLNESPNILDTGGGLKAAADKLTNPTATLNPDYVWDGPNPLNLLLDNWSEDFQALLLVVPLSRAINRDAPGDFHLTDGSLRRGGDMVYTGAQIIRTDRLKEISDTIFSLNSYWDVLSNDGGIHGIVYPGTWTDIGTKQALIRANEALDV